MASMDGGARDVLFDVAATTWDAHPGLMQRGMHIKGLMQRGMHVEGLMQRRVLSGGV